MFQWFVYHLLLLLALFLIFTCWTKDRFPRRNIWYRRLIKIDHIICPDAMLFNDWQDKSLKCEFFLEQKLLAYHDFTSRTRSIWPFFASANNTSNVSLLRNLRMKNPKNIIFSCININSIRNKFDNVCDLISKDVDILSVAETKLELDPSFPNS